MPTKHPLCAGHVFTNAWLHWVPWGYQHRLAARPSLVSRCMYGLMLVESSQYLYDMHTSHQHHHGDRIQTEHCALVSRNPKLQLLGDATPLCGHCYKCCLGDVCVSWHVAIKIPEAIIRRPLRALFSRIQRSFWVPKTISPRLILPTYHIATLWYVD